MQYPYVERPNWLVTWCGLGEEEAKLNGKLFRDLRGVTLNLRISKKGMMSLCRYGISRLVAEELESNLGSGRDGSGSLGCLRCGGLDLLRDGLLRGLGLSLSLSSGGGSSLLLGLVVEETTDASRQATADLLLLGGSGCGGILLLGSLVELLS